jgi:hypothetical protein
MPSKKTTPAPKDSTSDRIIRRSFALPRHLVEEAQRTAPPDCHNNLNRLVTLALQAWVERQATREFETAMQEMASDSAIQSESKAITRSFLPTDGDGL